MRWPDACEALGSGFDHCTEGVSTQRALQLETGADSGQIVLSRAIVKQCAIGALFVGCAEGEIDRAGVTMRSADVPQWLEQLDHG